MFGIGVGFITYSLASTMTLGEETAATSAVPTEDDGGAAPAEDNGGDRLYQELCSNLCGSIENGTTIADQHNGNFVFSQRPVDSPTRCAALCSNYEKGKTCHSCAWHSFYEKQPGEEDEWFSKRCFLFSDLQPQKIPHNLFTSGTCGSDPL